MTVSAYMIAHCDDDFLAEAIDSVINHVDELIFVDGAYEWVAPYLTPVGIDPEKSWPTTHEILARYGKKIKYFSGLWRDELHKRSFGFSQCRGDFVIRIDADEIFSLDLEHFKAFQKSGKSVADMDFPYMVTENLQRLGNDLSETPRQVCMFKRRNFRNALDHCGYLWLVLTDEEKSRVKAPDWKQLYPHRVAKTAHLTALRTPRTALNRARFYTLQHIRSTGQVPFGIEVEDSLSGDARIGAVLEAVGSQAYTAYLAGHQIVSGFAHMDGFHLAPYGFEAPTLDVIRLCLEKHSEGLADFANLAQNPRDVLSDQAAFLNITCLMRPNLSRITLTFAEDIKTASGHLYFLLSGDNSQDRILVGANTHIEGRQAILNFRPINEPDLLQACLVLLVSTGQAKSVAKILRIEVS